MLHRFSDCFSDRFSDRFSDFLVALTPLKAMILLSGVQILLWTLVPYFAFHSPPLDVVENMVWGAQWQLGYYKHPPLQAWLTEIGWQLGGMIGIYAVSQLCVVLTYWGIFLLGRDVTTEKTALMGVFIYALCFYATIPSPEFNTNILQAPFWAFAGWFLYRAITRTSQKNALKYWIGLGAVLAGAFYAKYSVVFLVVGLMLAALSQPKFLDEMKKSGIYIGGLICLSLCLPHFIWLLETDFMSFDYAFGRSHALVGLDRLTKPLTFLLSQLLDYILPIILLIVAGVTFKKNSTNTKKTKESNYLDVLAITPLLTMALWGIINGSNLRSMWGAPAAIWLGLLLASHISLPKRGRRLTIAIASGLVFFVSLPFFTGYLSLASVNTTQPKRTAWNGAYLTQLALQDWQSVTGTQAPDLVIGPTWEAGLVVHFLPNRPKGFHGTSPKHNPWVSPAEINHAPALIVWRGESTAFDIFGPFARVGSKTIMYKRRESTFNWAVREANKAHKIE